MLTETNHLQYFKTEDTRQPLVGSVPLNCLCAIDTYNDDDANKNGQYTLSILLGYS